VFLLRSEPLEMEQGCFMADEFLGDFFIRKCMWSTPGSIRSSAASFKKFYKCMLERGAEEKESYDFLIETIARTWISGRRTASSSTRAG